MNDALDKKLDTLVQIILFCGGFFGGAERRTITFDGENILVERECYNGMNPGEEEINEYLGRKVAFTEKFGFTTVVQAKIWDEQQ